MHYTAPHAFEAPSCHARFAPAHRRVADRPEPAGGPRPGTSDDARADGRTTARASPPAPESAPAPGAGRQCVAGVLGSCNGARKAICFGTETVGLGPNSTKPCRELSPC